MNDPITFLEGVIQTLEKEIENIESQLQTLTISHEKLVSENEFLRFSLQESEGASQALGDAINNMLEGYVTETMLFGKKPIGDA